MSCCDRRSRNFSVWTPSCALKFASPVRPPGPAHTIRAGIPSIGIRLLLRVLVRRQFFYFFGSATVICPIAAGNAQTLFPGSSYSPHRNPEARPCAGVRPSASGFFFGFWFCAAIQRAVCVRDPVGNAQTLIRGISCSPYRNPEASKCAKSGHGNFIR